MTTRKKELLKLVLLIIIIISLPLIFISLELLQKFKDLSNIDPSNTLTSTLDMLYENVSSTPKNSDSSTIRKCISEIFSYINDKNYNELYELLTDDIKNLIYPTKEDFINYMITYFGENQYSPKFSNYEKLNKEKNTVYIVKVDFIPYSTEKDDISNNIVPDMSDTFTLYIDDSNLDYKFSFLSYIGAYENNSTFENDEVSCTLVATHLYTTQSTFEIEITNKTNTPIFIGEEEIYVKTGIMTKYYPTSVFIPANSSTVIQYTIYTGLNLKTALPKKIYFKGIHVNDTVYIFYFPIQYPVNLYALY